eukprot:CAMPEP_0179025672 /NCGR_PEP_ID=MMETSP0796-20121207/8110_1 /TAXON_ID=73915 /ORGANISM="Pyrodinium bahamense, Strain pbaha01" /LENGTH=411 /DNA_ID=CAMNT_0020721709 /DNA_START=96 /DNA_END=1332 /DNA_ORIENTATION=-
MSEVIAGDGPMRLHVEECRFEDLAKHPWSAAVSVGRLGCGATGPYLDEVRVVRSEVFRCSLGIAASSVQLLAEDNRLMDLMLAGVQLVDSRTLLSRNRVERCGGAGIAFSSGPANSIAGGSVCELCGNTVRHCDVGLRVSSSGALRLRLLAAMDTFEGNGDAICTLGSSLAHMSDGLPLQEANDFGVVSVGPSATAAQAVRCRAASCTVEMTECNLLGSRRCGLRVGRATRIQLRGCAVMGNGRGVVVAARAAVDVQGCCFQDNIGWALRLEDRALAASTAVAADCGLRQGADGGSVVAGNVFAAAGRKGNIGRKRVRVDTWHEGSTTVEGNLEAGSGTVVEPETKRQRQLERQEVDIAATQLAGLGLGIDPAIAFQRIRACMPELWFYAHNLDSHFMCQQLEQPEQFSQV